MESHNQTNEMTKLLDEIQTKDSQLTYYEHEIEKLLKSQEEILKLINSKDSKLAEQIKSHLVENSSENKESNPSDYVNSISPDIKHRSFTEKFIFRKSAFLNKGGIFKAQQLIKNIVLTIRDQLEGIIDEKLFTPYQKEILSYYNGHGKNIGIQNFDFPNNSLNYKNEECKFRK